MSEDLQLQKIRQVYDSTGDKADAARFNDNAARQVMIQATRFGVGCQTPAEMASERQHEGRE